MDAENGETKSKMEDYEMVGQIERGSSGAAFLARHIIEKKKYMVKKIRLSKNTDKFKCAVLREMNSFAKLKHPYIVEYKDFWMDEGDCICTVTDYCEEGDLYEMVRKSGGKYFQEEKICKWLTQLLLAIDYLHSNRILHGNLKLSNICITKENDVHLCDFGLSKLLNKEGIVSSFVGTPNYMCPELVSDLPYGYKSDIWSLGCCIFEIAAHQQPFRAPDMAGLINKINRSLISPLPIFYSSTLKQIIKSMLRKSPEHRPTAAELLRHPHLQPFVIHCCNPSAVFLPVKSPSSNNSKEKSKKHSPKSFNFGKDNKVREAKLKQRDLLPFFEKNSVSQYTNSLDGIALIEDKLETKRVDPTSYDGKISHDSQDSESGDTTCETAGCNGGDDQDNFYYLPSHKEMFPLDDLCEEHNFTPKNAENFEDTVLESRTTTDVELISSPRAVAESETEANGAFVEKCSNVAMPDCLFDTNAVPIFKENQPRKYSPKEETENDLPAENSETRPATDTMTIKELILCEPTETDNGDTRVAIQEPTDDPSSNNNSAVLARDETRTVFENPGLQRADALESLLELCAQLLKQDKIDELSGVLKPFGEDVVSSRETGWQIAR